MPVINICESPLETLSPNVLFFYKILTIYPPTLYSRPKTESPFFSLLDKFWKFMEVMLGVTSIPRSVKSTKRFTFAKIDMTGNTTVYVLFSCILSKKCMIFDQISYRQPILWYHELCLEVLAVHVNELCLF